MHTHTHTHTPTHHPPAARRDIKAKAQRASQQATALRALRPKAALYAQQSAALGPLRAQLGELQQQISAREGEVRARARARLLPTRRLPLWLRRSFVCGCVDPHEYNWEQPGHTAMRA